MKVVLCLASVMLLVGQSYQQSNKVCKLKPETGRCRAYFRRFFYDPDSEKCKQFIYGGCGGNANNFKTKAECENKCVPVCPPERILCELELEVGRCRARKRRFFYDTDSHKCEEFFYGGCGGNANNFKTIAECEKTCIPVCNLKPEVGHCRAAIPRFFYDPDAGTCKEFSYGGCGGNANNFKTIAECEDRCA